jgi:hypothetical protein
MNSNDKATSSGKIASDCNCSELVKDITTIINSLECKKNGEDEDEVV